MRILSLVIIVLVALKGLAVSATNVVEYSSCDTQQHSSIASSVSWSTLDAVSSKLAYRICPSRPNDLRFAYDLRLSVYDGADRLLERVLPACRFSTTDCVQQLATTGCIQGEFTLRIPVVAQQRSELSLEEMGVGNAVGISLVSLCSK